MKKMRLYDIMTIWLKLPKKFTSNDLKPEDRKPCMRKMLGYGLITKVDSVYISHKNNKTNIYHPINMFVKNSYPPSQTLRWLHQWFNFKCPSEF